MPAFSTVRYRKCYALTCTDTNSGLRREFWMDLTASSAVNLPITSASLRLVVVWMGARSIRCTYSGARVPPRFTFTTNLVFFMGFPLARDDKQMGGKISRLPFLSPFATDN